MPATLEGIPLSRHAQTRMAQRGLRASAILAAIDYGREIRSRGAWFHVIGRRDVARARALGVDVSRHEGVHVLRGDDGGIITVYRNKNLDLRQQTPRRRHRRTH